MKPVDEIVLFRHSSGMRITLSPRFEDGALCVWLSYLPTKQRNGTERLICRYESRAGLAKWLRRAADKIEE